MPHNIPDDELPGQQREAASQKRLHLINLTLADQLGCDESDISPEKTLVDLGLDSLDTVELIMRFEEEFDIEIEEEEVAHIRTVGDVIAYVERALE